MQKQFAESFPINEGATNLGAFLCGQKDQDANKEVFLNFPSAQYDKAEQHEHQKDNFMKILTLIAAGLIGFSMPSASFAAGSGGGTSTKKKCKSGRIYDKKLKKCVVLKSATDDAIYETAMGLAYRGKYETAIGLLKVVKKKDDPRILNYMGFTHRKLGMNKKAMVYYARALEINPNYILARSYMGQGLVSDGDLDGARVQLAEIGKRKGENNWAYRMLENAITSGMTF